mmetsp:Transcript_11505/g.42080  ORF Transcript_11505/g.42080 Transcript_11505/m.42080 type:complete len:162 (-) Transcript_11505:16-501(-)
MRAGIVPTCMWQSRLTRAQQTAAIIQEQSFADVPLRTCEMLNEGVPCRNIPERSDWQPRDYQTFQDSARIEAAFRKHIHRALPSSSSSSSAHEVDTEIIVCHANVIRYFVLRALQLAPEAWLRLGLRNCSLTVLEMLPNGRVSLRTLGSEGHLPAACLTDN